MTDFPSSPVTVSTRDAFEAWAASDNRAIQPLEFEERADDNNHYYESDYDNNAFIGWKASAGLAPTSQQWQPIETAPENHFPVQVYGLYGQLVAFRDVNWIWWSFPNGEDPLNYTPTHWKPLGPNPSDSSTLCGDNDA